MAQTYKLGSLYFLEESYKKYHSNSEKPQQEMRLTFYPYTKHRSRMGGLDAHYVFAFGEVGE